jgi:hypothetical protein
MSNSNSRDEWDAMAEVTRCPVPTPAEHDEHTALRDAVAAARAAERAAVVAWLRSTVTARVLRRLWRQEPMDAAADAIERGEHRREEGK